ncbi:PorP/SprF family type IX secretion system membrane protein [Maribacter sp. 2308TA10-17]|uniref:PorP/SprF family type IX secretion system membrane protein n=1 Tax=Maribacter sp. 2308TA10-17 TaxID=3386276 RepID=UPI0039BC33D0
MKLKHLLILPLIALASLTSVNAQEDDPILPYQVAPQNLLKFNRFLINPTFSTVREDNSYINLLHRNQSVSFDNNDQTYFLSYSGRVSDRSGLGLSLYTQKVGAVSNIGALANMAYGIKLSDKSNFTFGANLAYYSSGLNKNDLDPLNPIDEALNGREDSNVLSFQPGFNLSYGQFDFGVFAENLFDYNLKTSKTLTDFSNKTYSAHLQYTYPFDKSSGILESGRLMPLARVRMNPRSGLVSEVEQDLSLGGSLILDLPKLGWLQGGYDTFYGASAGAGFNINQRLSLGYTMEKGFGTDFNNLGVTHEISLAYSFTPNLTEDRVMLEEGGEELVENDEELNTDALASNDEVEALKRKLAENEEVLAELMFRQDSLEANRQKDLERRFEMVMRMVRNETKGNRPDVEQRAEQLFLTGKDRSSGLVNNSNTNQNRPSSEQTESKNTAQDKIVAVPTRNTKPIENNTPSSNAVAQDNTKASDYTNNADRDAIKSRKFKNLDGVDDGYYLIANVYKGGQYMNNFMDRLNDQGFSSNYVDNTNNGLKYVYLERFDTWQEAADAYKSNLDGRYNDDLWVMNVDNRYSNEAYASNVDKIQQKSAKYNTDELERNIVVKDRVAATKANPKNFQIKGVGSGYYIIANVFAKPSNAKKFVRLLNSFGLNASYFINPENNWRYVYLKKHESWNNALISYYSKINDSYDDKMWIMRVNPNTLA